MACEVLEQGTPVGGTASSAQRARAHRVCPLQSHLKANGRLSVGALSPSLGKNLKRLPSCVHEELSALPLGSSPKTQWSFQNADPVFMTVLSKPSKLSRPVNKTLPTSPPPAKAPTSSIQAVLPVPGPLQVKAAYLPFSFTPPEKIPKSFEGVIQMSPSPSGQSSQALFSALPQHMIQSLVLTHTPPCAQQIHTKSLLCARRLGYKNEEGRHTPSELAALRVTYHT